MSPLAALAATGDALHGPRWRSPLARQLQRPGAPHPGISLRLLQLWQSGDRPPPDWLRGALVDVLHVAARDRAAALEKLASRIATAA